MHRLCQHHRSRAARGGRALPRAVRSSGGHGAMIGKPIPRIEDRRFVTGRGQYTDDLRLDHQAYAAFARSPHAHAVLRSIDTRAASTAPGVIAVLTARDYIEDGLQGVDHIPNPIDAIDPKKKAF